ncbi:MDR family MFS transporter [Microbacterium sp. No. 7]|uniref:MDR family MFS transporter n=1 Tax=Microbacterium sp. No. 7 TaxID=1714373 RepID=UPI0006D07579|nr:MDR family MFS transporter [Microbacterium sp. No. 7]ALJ21207.1 hypothetical protein AOA12_15375 [Microbacterium sp. No. 7]
MSRAGRGDAQAAESGGQRRGIVLLFSSLALVMLLASLNSTVFAPVLPSLVASLQGLDMMPWVLAAYLLASVAVMPVCGRVSDAYGRKPVLLAAIIAFAIGSLIGALAQDMETVIVGRAVQGLGGGGLVLLSQAAVADVVPARERGRYAGILGGVFAAASVGGPLLGGWFAEGPGWRWAFWINVPLSVIAAVGVIVLLRLPVPSRPEGTRLDFGGMLLMAVVATVVSLIASWGGTALAWASPEILVLAAIGLVAIAALVLVERRVSSPVMPPLVFRDRDFLLSTVAALLLFAVMFGVLGYVPTYLQMVGRISAVSAGLHMVPMAVVMLVGTTVSGMLISRTGRYRLYPVAGGVLVAVGMLLLALLGPDASVWWVSLHVGIVGLGLGLSTQVLLLVVQNAFPHSIVGTATGAHSLIRQIGALLGTAVVGSLFTATLANLMSTRLPGVVLPSPEALRALPEQVQTAVAGLYNEALTPVFAWMAPLGVLAAIASGLVSHRPLAREIDRR